MAARKQCPPACAAVEGSLIQHPASMTHACVPREKRERTGIRDGLVRILAGVEDVVDLLQALEDGAAKV